MLHHSREAMGYFVLLTQICSWWRNPTCWSHSFRGLYLKINAGWQKENGFIRLSHTQTVALYGSLFKVCRRSQPLEKESVRQQYEEKIPTSYDNRGPLHVLVSRHLNNHSDNTPAYWLRDRWFLGRSQSCGEVYVGQWSPLKYKTFTTRKQEGYCKTDWRCRYKSGNITVIPARIRNLRGNHFNLVEQ